MSLPPALLAPAPQAVFRALPRARAVGGCVRDWLAGLPLHDLDMAAPGPPQAIAAALEAAGFKVFGTGLAHGTVTAVLDHLPIEVTALRRDVATDGRHATVEWTDDWQEDAARRDFTINAMSLGADGALHDHFGGAADLRAGRVRFVGDAAIRLREDHLRALRFFRFQARYGRGAPDAAALEAIRGAVPLLARLSAERVWMELKRLLEAPDPRGALALMAGSGVLGAVLPEAGSPGRLDPVLDTRDPLLRLAALLPPGTDLASLSARLRWSGAELARMRALHDVAALEPRTDALARRRMAARLRARSPAAAPGEVARVAAAEDPQGPWAALFDLPAGADFPLQGRDALAAGLPPGPALGRLLGEVREWWIAGGAAAGREQCLAELVARARA
ncbi:CCA tRNA nucleotidyltransferase [Roseococcus sp. DSY-14]|uniref:CCA tRNA nucleotidyltransferase n=1 Tax=Roseococcus sp. DSY-14 TaxID=3369650 RepID=UPI00387B8F58